MIVIFHIRQITNAQRYFNIRLGHRYMNTPTQMNQTSSGCAVFIPRYTVLRSYTLKFSIQLKILLFHVRILRMDTGGEKLKAVCSLRL